MAKLRFVVLHSRSTLSLCHEVAPPQNVKVKIRSNLGVLPVSLDPIINKPIQLKFDTEANTVIYCCVPNLALIGEG